MKRAVIRKGDPTSHGGTVLEGCETVKALGKPVARQGNKTYCPLCRGDFPISEGCPTVSAFGKAVALEGMKTACGAVLIATQHTVNVADGSAGENAADGWTGNEPNKIREETGAKTFTGRFRALDSETGQPIGGLKYRIRLSDGGWVTGTSDEDGYTQLVSSSSPDTIELHWDTDVSDQDH